MSVCVGLWLINYPAESGRLECGSEDKEKPQRAIGTMRSQIFVELISDGRWFGACKPLRDYFLLVLYVAEESGKGNTKFLGRKWGQKIPSLWDRRHIFTQNRF